MAYKVFGCYGQFIYFDVDGKHIFLKNTLPKQDLILKLGITPNEVKQEKEQIYIEAMNKKLTKSELGDFIDYNHFQSGAEYAHWRNQMW